MQLERGRSTRNRFPLALHFSMLRHFCIPALLLGFIFWTPSRADSNPLAHTFVGYAYDGDTKALLYKEIHHESVDESGEVELKTLYLGPEGETIATRYVDFSDDFLAPQFRFRDSRAEYSEGLYREGSKTFVFRHFRDRPNDEIREISGQNRLVADAGFDRLVTANWNQLLLGDKVHAEFLVPARLRTLQFVIQKEREWVLDGVPVVTFRMTSANLFLRVLVGPIRVTYHRDDRCLMVYEGFSNIKGPGDEGLNLRIEFPLDERNPGPASRPSW